MSSNHDARYRPNTRIGHRYILHERIALGGTSEVYRGFDPTREAHLAVKISFEGAHETGHARTLEQAAFAHRLHDRSLSHRNARLVPLLDFGVTEDAFQWPFFVMPLLRGSTLARSLLRRRETRLPFSLPTAADVGIALAEVLTDIHSEGLVHCDIKPSNVCIDRAGGETNVHLLDYGAMTRVAERPPAWLVGTIEHGAPELLLGELLRFDSDVFSVGVLLYEMLSLRSPWAGHALRGLDDYRRAHMVGRTTVSLADCRPDLPPEVCSLIDRCFLPASVGSASPRPSLAEMVHLLSRHQEPGRVRSIAPSSPGDGSEHHLAEVYDVVVDAAVRRGADAALDRISSAPSALAPDEHPSAEFFTEERATASGIASARQRCATDCAPPGARHQESFPTPTFREPRPWFSDGPIPSDTSLPCLAPESEHRCLTNDADDTIESPPPTIDPVAEPFRSESRLRAASLDGLSELEGDASLTTGEPVSVPTLRHRRPHPPPASFASRYHVALLVAVPVLVLVGAFALNVACLLVHRLDESAGAGLGRLGLTDERNPPEQEHRSAVPDDAASPAADAKATSRKLFEARQGRRAVPPRSEEREPADERTHAPHDP